MYLFLSCQLKDFKSPLFENVLPYPFYYLIIFPIWLFQWSFTTHACMLSFFSRVWLFVASWIVARWLLCPCHFPGKNTGVGYNVLLQGLFPTQGLNPPSSIAGGFFMSEPLGKPVVIYHILYVYSIRHCSVKYSLLFLLIRNLVHSLVVIHLTIIALSTYFDNTLEAFQIYTGALFE